jgi:pimeloyl-ACP methyl ester carboxylesterase
VRILVVPGLAVRRYIEGAVDELRVHGHEAVLLAAPAQREEAADLASYGAALARRLQDDGREVDLLIGLSVGSQAAAVAAAGTPLVRRLLLVSPTVDPVVRSMPRLLAAWVRGGIGEKPALLRHQFPDWQSTSLSQLSQGLASALQVPLEDVLLDVGAQLTVAHSEHDRLTSHAYAARLAYEQGGQLVTIPGASHSWPYEDSDRFRTVVESTFR